jgi:hypothetical protein
MAVTGRSEPIFEKKPLALPSTPAPNVFHYIVDLGEPEPGAV